MINGELIIDNFAGGGGASTGIELATGYSVDVAINHDPEAIRMHMTNHPDTKHYCEDVWQVNPLEVCDGHPVALAWFSPDCKHFSKAKGGKPKSKKIRGLAWVALRWAGLVRPRVIMLENVEEFQTWGPLNRSHRPIKSKRGVTFNRFISQLKDLGYEVEYRELTAADYGAPTKRKRFFLIARCDGAPIVWPQATHAPADSEKVKSGLLKPYEGAYTQIDFSLPCPSIFESSEEIKEKYGIKAVRPLAPKTMERIARGLVKFVIENKEPFIIQVNHSGSSWDYCKSMNEPLPVITSKHGFGIVAPVLTPYIMCNNENNTGGNVREGLPTITTGNRNFIVAPALIQYHSETSEKEFTSTFRIVINHSGRYEHLKIDIFNTNEKYQIIYTDPPWEQTKSNKRKCRPNQGKELDYQTLSIEEIKNIHKQVFGNLCDTKHNIFMWTIDKYLHKTENMMKELGYALHARLVWDKENGIAPAFTVRFSHEYLLWFYRKGKILMPCEEMRGKYTTILREKSTKHSKKPICAYEMLENMFPDCRRLEMFARNERDKWDCWGNEVRL